MLLFSSSLQINVCWFAILYGYLSQFVNHEYVVCKYIGCKLLCMGIIYSIYLEFKMNIPQYLLENDSLPFPKIKFRITNQF